VRRPVLEGIDQGRRARVGLDDQRRPHLGEIALDPRHRPGADRELAAKLATAGIACYRVQFPRGMDANDYALKVTPAAKSLGLVLRRAAWLGGGSAPASTPLLKTGDTL
jgi:hypothetical protein